MPIRRAFLAALAVTAALGLAAPAAGASTLPAFTIAAGAGGTPAAGVRQLGVPLQAAGPCGHATSDGQGGVGLTESQVCLGSGLSFVGPAIGQIATVIGPTIIGPAVLGTSIVTTGNVAGVP